MSQQGILLINLGSPDSTSVRDVRRYLGEFLMDPKVIDVAWPLRTLIVRGFILPFRPRKSAEAYEQIWTPAGSPLVVTGRRVREKLETLTRLPVELAMRYRLPTPADALLGLQKRGVTEAALVPLFPHFAMSSFETAVEHVQEWQKKVTPGLRLKVAAPYFEDPSYIQALAASTAAHLVEPYDHLLFSFHGVPERHLRKSDPTGKHCLASADCCRGQHPAHATCYRAQCLRTADAVAARCQPRSWSVAFQSRLGRDPWLTPFTDQEIVRLAKSGVKRLLVICPAFVADCLETLEEIGMRGRELFLEAGGTSFGLIPCLNERPDWIEALAGIARRTLAGKPDKVAA
jgi:ferrochelatase